MPPRKSQRYGLTFCRGNSYPYASRNLIPVYWGSRHQVAIHAPARVATKPVCLSGRQGLWQFMPTRESQRVASGTNTVRSVAIHAHARVATRIHGPGWLGEGVAIHAHARVATMSSIRMETMWRGNSCPRASRNKRSSPSSTTFLRWQFMPTRESQPRRHAIKLSCPRANSFPRTHSIESALTFY